MTTIENHLYRALLSAKTAIMRGSASDKEAATIEDALAEYERFVHIGQRVHEAMEQVSNDCPIHGEKRRKHEN